MTAAWGVAQPPIVPRATWDTTTSRSAIPAPKYANAVKAVFVHHTDSGNTYQAAEVPEIIYSIDGDQTGNRGWDDIGYNFLVDRFGTIYEGRRGGIDRPVIGAHSSGFNFDTAGIAAIGSFDDDGPVPQAMLDSIARLAAWKLGLHAIGAHSSVTLTCSNPLSRFSAGSRESFNAVSGHRDADCTLCPGASLYLSLPGVREQAARIQLRARNGAPAAAQFDPRPDPVDCRHPGGPAELTPQPARPLTATAPGTTAPGTTSPAGTAPGAAPGAAPNCASASPRAPGAN
ncbi:peptidoglycan recognition protein [Streptacidiphilus sp. 4-A2]|nr:peptidoglycan recognition protein [Streptacidiphilus sp. 4-A2]